MGPAPDGIGDSERVAETVPLLSLYTVETNSLPEFGVDETVESVDENVHYVGHGNEEGLVLVDENVHHVGRENEEGLAIVDPPAEALVAPIAEPEDDGDPFLPDPLAVSPLLVTLGFDRVQTAYEQWLVNMSHAVSLI